MRIAHAVLAAILVLACLGTVSQAVTITISPGQSIQNALNSAGSGGTVILNNGTYTEGGLHIPNGAAGAPTILKAANQGQALIRPGVDTTCILCLSLGAHHQTIDGVIIDGGDSSGGTALSNRKVAFVIYDENQHTQDSVSDITITNAEIRLSRHSCFLVAGIRWTITNSNIHHCGVDNGSSSGTPDHGIYYSARNGTLDNNLIHDNIGYGIQNYSSNGLNVSGNTHTRNTYYNNTGGGITIEFNNNGSFINNVVHHNSGNPGVLCCGNNAKIYNNTVVSNSSTGIEVQHNFPTDQGAQVRNNISCGNGSANLTVIQASQDHNLTSSCPAFLNAGAQDYHLASGSAAIDQGASLTTDVPIDHDGVTRPQGSAYDIGAYEFGQGGGAVFLPAPSNLRITNTPNGP